MEIPTSLREKYWGSVVTLFLYGSLLILSIIAAILWILIFFKVFLGI